MNSKISHQILLSTWILYLFIYFQYINNCLIYDHFDNEFYEKLEFQQKVTKNFPKINQKCSLSVVCQQLSNLHYYIRTELNILS